MNFYQKINKVSEGIMELKEKLEGIAVDFLNDEDKIEYYKIMQLTDFHIASLLELIMEENKEFVKNNIEFVKDIIKNVESFTTEVNDNLNI
jgi:hypothetical protein